jgi:hypothetical protein
MNRRKAEYIVQVLEMLWFLIYLPALLGIAAAKCCEIMYTIVFDYIDGDLRWRLQGKSTDVDVRLKDLIDSKREKDKININNHTRNENGSYKIGNAITDILNSEMGFKDDEFKWNYMHYIAYEERDDQPVMKYNKNYRTFGIRRPGRTIGHIELTDGDMINSIHIYDDCRDNYSEQVYDKLHEYWVVGRKLEIYIEETE